MFIRWRSLAPVSPYRDGASGRVMNKLGILCTAPSLHLERDTSVWRLGPRRLGISNAWTAANPSRNGRWITKKGYTKLAAKHASTRNNGEALSVRRKGTQSGPLNSGGSCTLLGKERVTGRAECDVEAVDQG